MWHGLFQLHISYSAYVFLPAEIYTVDDERTFSVSLIPHTLENITLGKKKVGDYVNIETDLFGKYVEKILKFNNVETEKKEKSGITMDFLQKNGF